MSLVACGKPSVTGTYVGKSGDSVVLLDLVQADGGQVTGRLEGISLKPDGRLSNDTSSVSGLTDGKSVSLAVKPIALLPATVQITGKLEGRHLNVSAGGAFSADLVRSDVASFHGEAAKLRKRSSAMLAARAAVEAEQATQLAAEQAAGRRAALLQTIAALVLRVDQMNARLGSVAVKSATIEAGYARTTEQMAALLERERSLRGDARSFQRSQVSFAIQQGASSTERSHSEVQLSQSELGRSLKQLATEVGAALSSCRDLAPEVTEPPLQAACADLGNKAKAMGNLAEQGDQNLRSLEHSAT